MNSLSNRRARLHQLARRTGLLDLIRAQKEPYWLERWQNIGDLHDEANLDALEFRNLLAVWPAGQPEFVVQGRIRAPLTLLDAMLYVSDACLNDNALNAVASVLVRKAEDEYVDPIVGSPMLWFWESEQAMDTIRHIAGRITSKTQRIFLPINVSSNGSTSISVEGKSNADHWILWVLVFKRHESRTLACQVSLLSSMAASTKDLWLMSKPLIIVYSLIRSRRHQSERQRRKVVSPLGPMQRRASRVSTDSFAS